LVILGVEKGAHVAGASDSYGYVSQAHMWATGVLKPMAAGYDVLPPGLSSDTLLPLGYRFTSDGLSLVPVYAPGLPIQMALFERLGGQSAVFYVMPLLAGVAAWATYALGARAGGRRVGAVAAVLFAASPAVLFQLTHAPMSDLPAAAWWTVALAALLRPSRSAALLCGIATGVAILTRPNLVPLAFVPGAAFLWSAVRSSDAGARAWQRLALFAAGSIPACAAVGVLNAYWYGSPFVSGYGAGLAGTMYQWDHFWPNVSRYARWMVETQGPTAAFAALAPAVCLRSDGHGNRHTGDARHAIAICTVFVVTVWLCYVFYTPFDAWWTLRFLLPAFPALCVLASAGVFRTAAWLPLAHRGQAVAAALAVALSFSVGVVHTYRAMESSGERRFATMGRSLAQQVPRQSVVLARLHSGSARYYAGRLTLRWDLIEPARFDAAVAVLQQRGYATFILVDVEEEELFRSRFGGASRFAALDQPPQITVPGAALYALK
jgi:4-amino-4-deoxy-L-arabinose transferase-like glycosyltransferase